MNSFTRGLFLPFLAFSVALNLVASSSASEPQWLEIQSPHLSRSTVLSNKALFTPTRSESERLKTRQFQNLKLEI